MPMDIVTTAGGGAYANPFVEGPLGVTHVKLDTSAMTTNEVDEFGYLKPGVPLDQNGRLLGLQALAGSGVAAAVTGNTGDGAFGAVTVSAGAKAGVYQIVCIEPAVNAGKFSVEDPDGILVGIATVAVAFSAGGIGFTIADGGTDFAAGDRFTVTVTLTAGDVINNTAYGVVIEAVKLPARTSNTVPALGTDTTDPLIAVATGGLLNRDIVEDNLGRALTAAELAALALGNFKLTTT